MISGIGPSPGSLLGSLGTTGTGFTSRASAAKPAVSADTEASFTDVFQSAVNNVSSLQKGADQQITGMLTGTADADVNKVMVSVEKADVAFQLMMQVRNKVVNAYQEMEKMQF